MQGKAQRLARPAAFLAACVQRMGQLVRLRLTNQLHFLPYDNAMSIECH